MMAEPNHPGRYSGETEDTQSNAAESNAAAIREETGEDAICFTAGFGGGIFGLGVVHAYLAADRKPPAVASGISYGAYCATAIQQCYRDLEQVDSADEDGPSGDNQDRLEAARWRLFRSYLWGLVEKPFESIWRAIPDRSDFFARQKTLEDPATSSDLKTKEAYVSRRRDLLVSLGSWLYRVPLKVSSVVRAIVDYALWKDGVSRTREGQEKKPATLILRAFHLVSLFVRLVGILERLAWAYGLRPSLVERLKGRGLRPLFGTRLWFISWAFVLSTLAFFWGAGNLLASAVGFQAFAWTHALAIVQWFLLRISTLFFLRSLTPLLDRYLCRHLGLRGGFLDDFHLLVRLQRLVGKDRRVDHDPFPIVLTAACLQGLTTEDNKSVTQQLVFARRGASLSRSLLAALRPSPLFGPQHIDCSHVREWLPEGVQPARGDSVKNGEDHFRCESEGDPDDPKPDDSGPQIDLLAGDALRQNPLPSMFSFLREDHFARDKESRGQSVASRLSSSGSSNEPTIHVVYGVPLGPDPTDSLNDSDPDADSGSAPDPQPRPRTADNLVDIGALGLRLSRRRDTQMEVRTTNFISGLEAAYVGTGVDLGHQDRVLPPLYADQIAPKRELRYDNPLDPSPDRSLRFVADGCRRTLEKLYESEIRDLAGGEEKLPCRDLLCRVTARRNRTLEDPDHDPGLPEVCQACSESCGCLLEVKADDDDGHDFENEPRHVEHLVEHNPSLRGDRPRIVVLLSGGVFRGSFHVGLVAALARSGIHPDLVAGASVGSLIGGAFGSLVAARGQPEHFSEKLETLVDAFVHVDTRVALTRRLLSAARQLSIRGSRLNLAPKTIRKMLLVDRQKDPGYATTGVPGPLVDALSMAFLIPTRDARNILLGFLSGRHAEAADLFWEAVKKSTLPRLYVERSLLGASLLRKQVHQLLDLGERGSRTQPFDGMAFLATATNLEQECLELLGAEPSESFSFADATLASSAFPTAFSPVRESYIKPGIGRTDLKFGDGGMFDNLPFLPALRTLALCQDVLAQGRQESDEQQRRNVMAGLRRRHAQPDLFIVGALDVNLDLSGAPAFQPVSIWSVRSRLNALRANSKIRGFQNSSMISHRLVGKILDAYDEMEPEQRAAWFGDDQNPGHRDLLARTVDAGILPVFPTDRDHLNPTFAFCSSMGLDRRRMRRSIGDGCFQTFRSLMLRPEGRDAEVRNRAVDGLTEAGLIPTIKPRQGRTWDSKRRCPFYAMENHPDGEASGGLSDDDGSFVCPFAAHWKSESKRVYRECIRDPLHQELADEQAGSLMELAELDAMS